MGYIIMRGDGAFDELSRLLVVIRTEDVLAGQLLGLLIYGKIYNRDCRGVRRSWRTRLAATVATVILGLRGNWCVPVMHEWSGVVASHLYSGPLLRGRLFSSFLPQSSRLWVHHPVLVDWPPSGEEQKSLPLYQWCCTVLVNQIRPSTKETADCVL